MQVAHLESRQQVAAEQLATEQASEAGGETQSNMSAWKAALQTGQQEEETSQNAEAPIARQVVSDIADFKLIKFQRDHCASTQVWQALREPDSVGVNVHVENVICRRCLLCRGEVGHWGTGAAERNSDLLLQELKAMQSELRSSSDDDALDYDFSSRARINSGNAKATSALLVENQRLEEKSRQLHAAVSEQEQLLAQLERKCEFEAAVQLTLSSPEFESRRGCIPAAASRE